MNILEKRLRKDHSHINLVLACLQYQIDRYGDSNCQSPDLTVALEAINYLHAYPEKWHHPLEDIIFTELQERGLDTKGVIAELRIEHEYLERQTQEVSQLFYSLANDCVVPLSVLKSEVQALIDEQRRHMETEHKHVYPLMGECFSDEDWARLEAQLDDVRDPLFGSPLRSDFADLYQYVLEAEHEGKGNRESV